MQSYFLPNENFFQIIQQHLPRVKQASLQHIKTGWTNIVICASDGVDEYFFRFPRNAFFAKMMLKDHSFCIFAKDKVTFQFPQLQLFYNQGRPFSCHKKIKGWSLSERIKFLSQQIVTNIAFDIAKFLKELDQIDHKTLPDACNMPVSTFLDELSTVETFPYDLSKHDPLRALESKLSVVHGDFNSGNILLDENDRMIGVIDFAFAGVSNRYVDIARIIGRSDPRFKKDILEAYSDLTHKKINQNYIQELVQMWNYVDSQYIRHMKMNHPEIQLPE